MRSVMKNGSRKAKTEGRPKTATGITKSVSMPTDLWLRIEARLATDPELDFSGYVRRLIRKDVAA